MPILFTDFGIVTLTSEVQPENAQLPILVTELGIIIFVINSHPWNAASAILVTESEIVNDIVSLPIGQRIKVLPSLL